MNSNNNNSNNNNSNINSSNNNNSNNNDSSNNYNSNPECLTEETASRLIVLGSALLCLSVLLTLILVPLSFSYIEWDRIGFNRNKIKNTVDTSKVFTNGRYFWGVGHAPLTFPGTFQNVLFKEGGESSGDVVNDDSGIFFEGPLAIFTKSGVEVILEVAFQYRIVRDELPLLFKKYGLVYHSQVVNIARAAIKNKAPDFAVDDFVKKRANITAVMTETVQRALAEIHIDVPDRKLQLRRVFFPPQVKNKYLVAATEIQSNKAKQFSQDAALVRKESDRLVSLINANTTAVNLVNEGEVARIGKEADADAERIVRTAEGNGMKLIFDTLGITDPDLKKEFLRLQAVGDDSKILMSIKSAIVNVSP